MINTWQQLLKTSNQWLKDTYLFVCIKHIVYSTFIARFFTDTPTFLNYCTIRFP